MKIQLEKKHYDLISAFSVGVTVGALVIRARAALKIKEMREDMALQIETIENSYAAAVALRDAQERLQTDIAKEVDIASNGGQNLVAVQDGKIVPLEETLAKPIEDVEAPDYLSTVNVTPTHAEPVKNKYHQALEAVDTPVEQFVDGGVNDYGVSYINEEDYEDEDGRYKGKIEVFLSDGDPVFLLNGVTCDDWDERVGDSILVDMFKLCPPGQPAVLYVRNQRTDEDYEVTRVEP